MDFRLPGRNPGASSLDHDPGKRAKPRLEDVLLRMESGSVEICSGMDGSEAPEPIQCALTSRKASPSLCLLRYGISGQRYCLALLLIINRPRSVLRDIIGNSVHCFPLSKGLLIRHRSACAATITCRVVPNLQSLGRECLRRQPRTFVIRFDT